RRNNRMAPYPYDSAGNYLPAGYTYDAENRLTAAAGINFDYDADGRRVKKSNGTLYWYGASGEVLEETNLSGTLTNEYVFFGGKRVARRNDGNYLSSATIQNASLSQANPWDSCGSICNYGPVPGWTSSGTGPTGSFQLTTSSYN